MIASFLTCVPPPKRSIPSLSDSSSSSSPPPTSGAAVLKEEGQEDTGVKAPISKDFFIRKVLSVYTARDLTFAVGTSVLYIAAVGFPP